jgi:hypothetical protein
MDRPELRLFILGFVRDRVPAPVTVDLLQRRLFMEGHKFERQELIVELAQLEACGYLVNLKHAADPVYKGVTGAAVAQLDMNGKLDPVLWGDKAL